MGLPLPLPDGFDRQASADLEWYFVESRAEQAGLRSNQGAIERALESGLQVVGPDGVALRPKQLRAIRRARMIERRLMQVPDDPLTILVLAHRDEHRLRGIGPRGVLYAHLPVAKASYEAAGAPLTLLDWLAMLAARATRKSLSKADKRLLRQLRDQAERLYGKALEYFAAVR